MNDFVLIHDNSKDLRIGKIISLIKSDDGEIRKVMLKTEHNEGLYPVTNLRFLENHPEIRKDMDNNVTGPSQSPVTKRVTRSSTKSAEGKGVTSSSI